MALSDDEMTKEDALRLLDALLDADVEHVRLDARKNVVGPGGINLEPHGRYRVTVLPADEEWSWNEERLERVLRVAKELNFRLWLHDDEFSFWRME
jgi:hypothetical protein